MKLIPSASQTVGPFYSIGLSRLETDEVPLRTDEARCTPSAPAWVEVSGSLLDGEGVPVPDAFLEVWQAGVDGQYAGEADAFENGHQAGFPGFARVPVSTDGTFRFRTVRPGVVAYDGIQGQAPHLLVLVFMRGLLRHLVTRMYFPDQEAPEPDATGTAEDPVLKLVPEARRSTLIAHSTSQETLAWDIVLRASAKFPAETVFFLW